MSSMWIARNKDGSLCLYKNRPFRTTPEEGIHDDYSFMVDYSNRSNDFVWDDSIGSYTTQVELDKALFPEVTWENSPVELKLDFGH